MVLWNRVVSLVKCALTIATFGGEISVIYGGLIWYSNVVLCVVWTRASRYILRVQIRIMMRILKWFAILLILTVLADLKVIYILSFNFVMRRLNHLFDILLYSKNIDIAVKVFICVFRVVSVFAATNYWSICAPFCDRVGLSVRLNSLLDLPFNLILVTHWNL